MSLLPDNKFNLSSTVKSSLQDSKLNFMFKRVEVPQTRKSPFEWSGFTIF